MLLWCRYVSEVCDLTTSLIEFQASVVPPRRIVARQIARLTTATVMHTGHLTDPRPRRLLVHTLVKSPTVQPRFAHVPFPELLR